MGPSGALWGCRGYRAHWGPIGALTGAESCTGLGSGAWAAEPSSVLRSPLAPAGPREELLGAKEVLGT